MGQAEQCGGVGGFGEQLSLHVDPDEGAAWLDVVVRHGIDDRGFVAEPRGESPPECGNDYVSFGSTATVQYFLRTCSCRTSESTTGVSDMISHFKQRRADGSR